MLKVLLNDKSASDSRILKRFNNKKLPYVSGLEIQGQSIYNVCPGKVVAVGQEANKTYSVSVLVNDKQMIRYTNLEYADVVSGQSVTFNTYIGRCKKFVRLEYCTLDRHQSIWPVRIKDKLMYKQDPEGLLNGTTKLVLYFDNTGETDHTDSIYYDNPMMEYELTNNKGDD